MKPGDRVRVTRGEHKGKTGVITDNLDRIDAITQLCKPSPTRTALLEKCIIPPGHRGIRLDQAEVPAAASFPPAAVIKEEFLARLAPQEIPVVAVPETRTISLSGYLEILEREASVRRTQLIPLPDGRVMTTELPVLSSTATLTLIAKLREACNLIDHFSQCLGGCEALASVRHRIVVLSTVEVTP